MANSYEGMGRFCEALKRVGELEKLIGGVSNANSSEAREYQAEHNRCVRKIRSYISETYSGDTLAFVVDFYQYMIGEKDDAVEEALAVQSRVMETERDGQRKKKEALIAKIEDLRSFLKTHYEVKGSEG